MSDFIERANSCGSKEDLEVSVKKSLKDLFNEPAASSIVYHLGGSAVIRDPKALKTKMEAVFGIGANLILSQILRNLENAVKMRKHRS